MAHAEEPPGPGDGGLRVDVLVPLPLHVGGEARLSYRSAAPVDVGRLLRVPLGRRTVTGVAWSVDPLVEPAYRANPGRVEPDGQAGLQAGAAPPVLRPIEAVLQSLPPLGAPWRRLLGFAAAYYQRGLGELVLSVLPPELRAVDDLQLTRRIGRVQRRYGATPPLAPGAGRDTQATGTAAGLSSADPVAAPAADRTLSADQQAALDAIADELAAAGHEAPRPLLLHGVTGSGKTEVYLRLAAQVFSGGGQVLLLVPEINLTPQLEARMRERFPQRRVVALHSGLTPAERLQSWLAAHLGLADLVLGTRLSIFASLPRLGLIVVDEEHDPSYKQQEGARYSARDLAVYRARLERIPVLLGSATPSLESWCNAGAVALEGDERGAARAGVSSHAAGGSAVAPAEAAAGAASANAAARYRLVPMPHRIGEGALPAVRLLDLAALRQRLGKSAMADTLLVPPLVEALRQRLAAGEQSLVLLNRRGYAPVLHCGSCGWKSACDACSAWRVFHKADRSLRCHHCGFTAPVPRACPQCGDPDIQPIGRGTERVEEQLADAVPGARIARIDADSTRAAGSLASQLAAAHAGEVDLLVGTQMLAKGHDFRRVTLVAVLNADSALFSSDFRAPERLFALLMQAGGRAGRDAAQAARSELWVPTWHVQHPLYAALKAHDYAAFAASQLAERRAAGLPPYTHLALLRAQARNAEAAMAFLAAAADSAADLARSLATDVALYPPVPAALQRVAHVEHAQMLVEAGQRAQLQRFLAAWTQALGPLGTQTTGLLRWAVDVDPAHI